jgi:hypothetical protein
VTRPFSFVIPLDYLPTILQPAKMSAFYLLPFQIISLGRRVSITVHIFISQLTPLYVSRTAAANGAAALGSQTMQRLGQLAQLSRITDVEASRLLELSLSPFRGDRESVTTLRRGMKEGLVVGSVRNAPEVQEAVAQVRRRRE